MSEVEPRYGVGGMSHVPDDVDGRPVTPRWVVEYLERVWAYETNEYAWGELVVVFEDGQLQLIRVNRTIKS